MTSWHPRATRGWAAAVLVAWVVLACGREVPLEERVDRLLSKGETGRALTLVGGELQRRPEAWPRLEAGPRLVAGPLL